MVLEAATAVGLLYFAPVALASWAAWSGMALVVVIWLSTVLLQIPCHSSFAVGFDGTTHERLVRSNWIRTLCWTLRSALLLVSKSRFRPESGCLAGTGAREWIRESDTSHSGFSLAPLAVS